MALIDHVNTHLICIVSVHHFSWSFAFRQSVLEFHGDMSFQILDLTVTLSYQKPSYWKFHGVFKQKYNIFSSIDKITYNMKSW